MKCLFKSCKSNTAIKRSRSVICNTAHNSRTQPEILTSQLAQNERFSSIPVGHVVSQDVFHDNLSPVSGQIDNNRSSLPSCLIDLGDSKISRTELDSGSLVTPTFLLMARLMSPLYLMHPRDKSLSLQGKLALDMYKDGEIANKGKVRAVRQTLNVSYCALSDDARPDWDVINLTELEHPKFVCGLQKLPKSA